MRACTKKSLCTRIERFFTSLKMIIHSPPVFDHLRLASEWRSFAHRQMGNRKILHFTQNDNPLPFRSCDHLRLASEWRNFVHRQMENRKTLHSHPHRRLASRPPKIWGQYKKRFQILFLTCKKLRPASEGRCRKATEGCRNRIQFNNRNKKTFPFV